MILLTDELNKKVRTMIQKALPNDSIAQIHGTFASGKSKYVSDVDMEVLISMPDKTNKYLKIGAENFQKLITKIKDMDDIYFTGAIIGSDDRFNVFCIGFNRDFSFQKFDCDKFKKEVQQFYKKKIINEEEHKKLLSFIKENATLNDLVGLRLYVEDNLFTLKWSYDEIMKGEKLYRQKKFLLYESIINDKVPAVITSIYKINPTIYLPVDMTILYYKSDKVNNSKLINQNNRQKILQFEKLQSYLLSERGRYTNLNAIFFGLLKNLYQKKWMKCIKRLRTILSRVVYTSNLDIKENRNLQEKFKKHFNLIKKIRIEILELNNTKFGMLNQLKNQLEVCSDLIDLIPIDDVIQIVFIKLEDIEDILDYSNDTTEEIKAIINKHKVDKERLKILLTTLRKTIFKNLNDQAKQFFFKYCKELQHILPFKIEEFL